MIVYLSHLKMVEVEVEELVQGSNWKTKQIAFLKETRLRDRPLKPKPHSDNGRKLSLGELEADYGT